MIKKAQQSRIKIIFLCAIIALLILSFLSYIRMNKLINESNLINHTNLVKLNLQNIFASVSEKESSMRVYMFSKDSAYLVSYFAADTSINLELNNFGSLTIDNPVQLQNAIVLRTAINKRIETMEHNLAQFHNSKGSIPDRLKGKALMDTVRIQIDKMKNEEAKLFSNRSGALSKSEFLTPWFTIVLIIGSIIILIASYFKIMRNLEISNTLKSKVEQGINELFQANKELAFQNDEKEKRADELIIANKELAFQNEEKEKRAAELIIANKELAFQNEEKEKRAAELIIANKELAFQNEEKEKRAAELIIANKELESFNYISSHDLQEPLRKIQTFASRLIADESQNLSSKGKEYALRMQDAASRMQALITDLLAYSRTNTEQKFETASLGTIIEAVKKDLEETIAEKKATIEVNEMCDAYIIPFQFRQLMDNIIGNALKFSKSGLPPHIIIKSRIIKGSKADNQKLLPGKAYCHITVTDNGTGFEPQYKDHIFELFKRLHDKEKITGTGIGLTIVKKIVDNHHGVITATGELNKGATFDIYIPAN
jgi:signal transduction histidine kinase